MKRHLNSTGPGTLSLLQSLTRIKLDWTYGWIYRAGCKMWILSLRRKALESGVETDLIGNASVSSVEFAVVDLVFTFWFPSTPICKNIPTERAKERTQSQSIVPSRQGKGKHRVRYNQPDVMQSKSNFKFKVFMEGLHVCVCRKLLPAQHYQEDLLQVLSQLWSFLRRSC